MPLTPFTSTCSEVGSHIPTSYANSLDIQELMILKNVGGWDKGTITHTSLAVSGMVPGNGLHHLRTFCDGTLSYIKRHLDLKNAECKTRRSGYSWAIADVHYGVDANGHGAAQDLSILLKRIRNGWEGEVL